MNYPYVRNACSVLDLVDIYREYHWGQDPKSYEELMEWLESKFIIIEE